MRNWKGNPHWMVRDEDADPLFDPRPEGCDVCGFRGGYGPDGEWDDTLGVEHTDLIWNRLDGTCEGGSNDPNGSWLCMECD